MRVVATEEAREQISNATRSLNGTKPDIVKSGPSCPLLDGVVNVDNLEAEVDPVDLLNLLDQLPDLSLDLNLPVASVSHRQSWQTGNGEPVFIGPILDPICEFGIDRCLERIVMAQLAMVMLKVGNAVFMRSDHLSNHSKLLLRGRLSVREHGD